MFGWGICQHIHEIENILFLVKVRSLLPIYLVHCSRAVYNISYYTATLVLLGGVVALTTKGVCLTLMIRAINLNPDLTKLHPKRIKHQLY